GLPFAEPPAFGEAGSISVAHRRLSQGNLCLGMPGVSRADPDRWTLDLLGALLGDGMSSRLFLELRERRSLAYDVSTFASMYADCGTVGVHAGFDPERVERGAAGAAWALPSRSPHGAAAGRMTRMAEQDVGEADGAYTIDLMADELALARAQIASGLSMMAEAVLVRRIGVLQGLGTAALDEL